MPFRRACPELGADREQTLTTMADGTTLLIDVDAATGQSPLPAQFGVVVTVSEVNPPPARPFGASQRQIDMTRGTADSASPW